MDESKRVGWSLVVLLAALLLVYVIFFDVHGDKLRITSLSDLTEAQSGITGADIDRMLYVDTTNQISNNANSDDVYYPSYYKDSPDLRITQPTQELVQSQNTQKNPLVIDTAPTIPYAENPGSSVIEDTQGRRFYSTDFLFKDFDANSDGVLVGTQANPVGVNAGVSNTTLPTTPQQQVLVQQPATTLTTTTTNPATVTGIQFPNTWVWDGMLTILQSLELDDDVQYILKDVNNTHYIYLGKWAGNVNGLVDFLGGSSVDITDQIVIQNSQLFGTKVTKITLPSYKRNLKELMIISFVNGDSRFIQSDKDWYNQLQNKLYIKQLFEAQY